MTQLVKWPDDGKIELETFITELYIDCSMKPIYLDIYCEMNSLSWNNRNLLTMMNTNKLSERGKGKTPITTKIGKCKVTIEFLEGVTQEKGDVKDNQDDADSD